MASLIASAVSTLLIKFGTGLAGKAGGWVFQEGLAAVTGGITDTARIREDIANVLKEVKQIQTSVTELSSQLSDSLLQLRKDSLRTYITDIETYYATIGDIMQEAFELPEKKLTDADRVRQAKGLQKRLNNRLRACSNDVPGYLDKINDFLNERGSNAFFQQAAQQALDQSDDFLEYYSKTKVMALNYWVAYIKGISLLQMAHDTPQVNFEEGSFTIDRHKANVLAQEKNFRSTVGEVTIALAEEVISDPNATRDLTWRTAGGTYIEAYKSPYANYVLSGIPGPRESAWIVKHIPSVTREDFDPTQGYPVLIEPSDRVDNPLCAGGSQYGLDTRWTTATLGEYQCRWFIKPRSPGEARFSFRFLSSSAANNGSYIVDNPASDLRTLNYVDSLHKEDGNQFFSVTLGEPKV
ncbi:uncharacterized protein FTJAE_5148 [Fusarium tjaetaba]|uniref:Uncharacterized protein n=1 Tax=Fusarium tjaetaba TaxID=1567544 RepID=A0A8H5RTG7_9HYPO|nr:uncharacterized protein FTJAE_5148 [Fusarium tjaetaba]KAF5638760.1 hypothetical protein FTJAE_5148 [Fusarium tjaetaba]